MALLHCEDDNFIEYFTSGLSRDDWADMNSQARARPPLCEASAVNAVGWLALKTGLRCHMTHLSSQWGLEEAELARKRGAVITVDTCPQYLLLNESAYDGREGQLFSVAPPLRSARDNKALWEGLERGAVDFATTNHCPFTRSQKAWQGTFEGIPRGLPGIETLLSLLFSEGVLRGRLSMNSLVRATSEGPARLFGLYPRKGCLLPGSDADIVVFDPEDQWTIRAGELRMNVDFSPYEGMEIMGRVWKTLSRGEIIYSDGRFLGKRGRGKFLSP